MLDQTFSWIDLPSLLLIAFLEILLSADNAVALASIARSLPFDQQKKALWAGFASSFVLRFIAIVFAGILIQNVWVQFAGGLYLLFLSIKHLILKSKNALPKPSSSFWKTVIAIELTDLVFAVDSILAAFAIVGVIYPINEIFPKLWIIYLGGAIGVVTMRFATSIVLDLMEKFPKLEKASSYLIGWIGLKLLVQSLFMHLHVRYDVYVKTWDYALDIVFWLGVIALLFYGLFSKKYRFKR